MSAAIRAGVHYLDFSAELDTYREALALDAQARAAGVMLLPGSGGSVAMLGSLAGHAVGQRMIAAIHAAISAQSPEQADRLTDFVVTTLHGFSAAAYAGMDRERLADVARLSGELLTRELQDT